MNNTHAQVNTYDHRSVKTGHPIRNHGVSIVFVVLATEILKEGVIIAGPRLT